MLSIDLSHHVTVITGATGDLGRVIARTFAACGSDVAIHYLQNREKAASLESELREMGVKALAVQADITDQASIEGMREKIRAELGMPNVLVNGAVIQYPWTSVLEQDIADYESQFRSCVLHNVLMAKAFVPDMIAAAKGGRIIALNTECAVQNTHNQSAYTAGKRGMDGVLRVLAREIGEHAITVNQIAPGWMISDRDRAKGSEKQEGYEKNIPLRRRGTDQEIANAVAFLASDLASYITGAFIPVCGGNVMCGI